MPARPLQQPAANVPQDQPETILLGWLSLATLPHGIAAPVGHPAFRPVEIPPPLVTYATYGAYEEPVF